MNIAIFTKEYAEYSYGGAGTHVTQLFKQLQKLASVSIHHFTMPIFQIDTKGRWPKPLNQIEVVLFKNLGLLTNMDLKTEIVHCHTWYSFLAGVLAKQVLGKKLVATFHSVEKLRPWKIEQLGSAYNYTCWIEQIMCDNADQLIAVSEACKQDILDAYSVPAEKITVIPNGVDKNCFRRGNVDNSELLKFNIRPDLPTVLTVSRLTKQKGIDYLLEVLGHLKQDWQIVLCLNNPDTLALKDEFSSALAKVKHKNVIWIDSKVSPNTLATLYRQARLFVSTAQYEPFGLTVAEALSCGTPVVARATGGISETIQPHSGGLLCSLKTPSQEFAEHVNQFLNEQHYQTVAKQAQGYSQHILAWPDVAMLTQKLYRKLL